LNGDSTSLLSRARGVLVLAMIAILFAGLDAAFIFSGPWLPYVGSTLPVFLLSGAVLMGAMGALSRFRCLYTGFQDEAVVILAGVAAGFTKLAGGVVDDRLYASTLVAVVVATVVTGTFFLLLGTLRLGRLIRYVPFSVTAGFMITIGGLLISGGAELAESRRIGVVASGLASGDMPWKALVALGCALVIVMLCRRKGGLVLLPLICAGLMLAFYVACALAGIDTATLAAHGWLPPAIGEAPRPPGWLLVQQAGVDWPLVASGWRSYLSVALISSLALLLAVTALELSTRQRVDVDRELRAAGIANLATAAAGGAAGYHDDIVTAMLHKSLAADRVTVLAAALLCAGAAAFSPQWFALVPLPLLGGIVMWLGWQLWRDWVFYSGSYLHRSDWIAVAAIAAVTLSIGFIAGVLLGIGVGIALFLVDYSQVSTVRYVVNGREIRSNVDRSSEAEQLLYDQGLRIHVVKLQGYLFFARAHQVLVQLEPLLSRLSRDDAHYIVLDFQGVSGVDSTATIAFVRLRQMAGDARAQLVFTGLGLAARLDLAREELAEGIVRYFGTLDQGLAWCEDQLLHGTLPPHVGRVNATHIFEEIVHISRVQGGWEPYLREVRVPAGETLIAVGGETADIFHVESGSLSVQIEGVGKERIVLRGLEPGSVFGEMAFYLGGRRSAAVVAETDAVLQVLGARALDRLERENPALAAKVHRLLARLMALKLRQTNAWLSHLR